MMHDVHGMEYCLHYNISSLKHKINLDFFYSFMKKKTHKKRSFNA